MYYITLIYSQVQTRWLLSPHSLLKKVTLKFESMDWIEFFFDLDGVMQYERGDQNTEQCPMRTLVYFSALDCYNSWVCIDLSSSIRLFKGKLFCSTFLWCCLLCYKIIKGCSNVWDSLCGWRSFKWKLLSSICLQKGLELMNEMLCCNRSNRGNRSELVSVAALTMLC